MINVTKHVLKNSSFFFPIFLSINIKIEIIIKILQFRTILIKDNWGIGKSSKRSIF